MELAVTLPLFVVLMIGTVDLGRAIMVRHKLVEASRAGCRLYTLKEVVTPEQAAAAIDKVMTDAGLAGYSYSFDPPSKDAIVQLGPVTATVTLPYDEVSWLPSSWFLAGQELTANCVMPGDTGELSSSGPGRRSGQGRPPRSPETGPPDDGRGSDDGDRGRGRRGRGRGGDDDDDGDRGRGRRGRGRGGDDDD